MSTYAIGDIHSCFEELTALLQRIRFDPKVDRLWLVGDLLNRGPGSLDVLRWARGLGDSLVSVLGNHDIHMLARAWGVAPPNARDTIEPILAAPDRDELLAWLLSRPLIHREGPYLIVHAGLAPQWSPEEAVDLARELEERLRGPGGPELVERRRDEKRFSRWDPSLRGLERARVALAAMTRLRTCDADGNMDLGFAGRPLEAAPGQMPWFEVPGRRSAEATVIFGHWAALGLMVQERVLGLDSGCVWGGALTAVRLEDRAIFQEATHSWRFR